MKTRSRKDTTKRAITTSKRMETGRVSFRLMVPLHARTTRRTVAAMSTINMPGADENSLKLMAIIPFIALAFSLDDDLGTAK
jgi:hypothetical protein